MIINKTQQESLFPKVYIGDESYYLSIIGSPSQIALTDPISGTKLLSDFLGGGIGDLTIESITTATTLDANHKNKVLECNGTFTITLPNGMSNGYTVDIVNVGAGIITIDATTTIQTKDSAVTITSQYGGISIYHRGSNIWLATGDLV